MSIRASVAIPGSSAVLPASPIRVREATASSCRTCPNVNRRSERAQGGRGAHRGEHVAHPGVAQQAHVVDAVGPGGHPRDQCHHLRRRVRPGRAGQSHMLPDQPGQPDLTGQLDHRDKPRHRSAGQEGVKDAAVVKLLQILGNTGIVTFSKELPFV